jgi:hypothetical protein
MGSTSSTPLVGRVEQHCSGRKTSQIIGRGQKAQKMFIWNDMNDSESGMLKAHFGRILKYVQPSIFNAERQRSSRELGAS